MAYKACLPSSVGGACACYDAEETGMSKDILCAEEIEYKCSDWGVDSTYTRTCTDKGWSNEDILCRDESTDLAAGLRLSVRGEDGMIEHTGCASVQKDSGHWIGVQFKGQSIDPYIVKIFDDPASQNQIVPTPLTVRLSRGQQVVDEHVIQADGAEFHLAGRNISGVWLTYPGMERICVINIYGQPYLGGCPTLLPPYPAVVEGLINGHSARLACPSGFVYAGGSREMYCDTDGSWKFVGSTPIECLDGQNLGQGASYIFYTTANADGLDSSTYVLNNAFNLVYNSFYSLKALAQCLLQVRSPLRSIQTQQRRLSLLIFSEISSLKEF
ncbi:hypothetical protein ElyMa_000312200 [Elysia marginata]|uniref:Sushi domain-containing protein n=1 Tax=Elysia marginata TaxID=1093978 RepID=A0AAV4FA46_9GAST|nr:hypothetical protein ElyMa_000312200 [Elysia marginata]